MDAMGSTTRHHTTCEVGLATALERLPSRVRAPRVTLRLHATDIGRGGAEPHARSVPVRWSTGRRGRGRRTGAGHLEVTPLASGGTRLGLRLHAAAPTVPGATVPTTPDAAVPTVLEATAPRLLRGLRDHLEAPPAAVGPRGQGGPRSGRRQALVVALLLGVPAVALGLATSVSAPTPVSVDDRVATFRADAVADRRADDTEEPSRGVGSVPHTAGEDTGTDGGEGADGRRSAAGQGPERAAAEAGVDGGHQDRDDGAAERGAAASTDTPEASSDGRGDEPAETRAARGRPDPGVYRYATTGGDRLSMRGSARDYPETTSVTVRHDDCGFTQRWDVFDERWEERRWCVQDGARALTATSSYREFFGRGQRNELACEGRTPPPHAVEPGAHWTVACEGDDTRSTTRVEVVGGTEVEVDGANVDTLHLRLETEVDGESTGRMQGQQWVVPHTGLLVREEWETEVETAGPMGPVTYTEDYTLRLESMEPAR
jgi:hypothetical protein